MHDDEGTLLLPMVEALGRRLLLPMVEALGRRLPSDARRRRDSPPSDGGSPGAPPPPSDGGSPGAPPAFRCTTTKGLSSFRWWKPWGAASSFRWWKPWGAACLPMHDDERTLLLPMVEALGRRLLL